MDSAGDSLDALPVDSNEPLAHTDLGVAQKLFKKSRPEARPEAKYEPRPDVKLPVALEIVSSAPGGTSSMTQTLMQNVKLTLLATALFLLLSHPKVDEFVRRLGPDTFTAYAIKGTIFAIIFFVLKHRFV